MRIDTKRGEGDKWERLVSDEVLDAVAVKGTPGEIPGLLQRRFGDRILALVCAGVTAVQKARNWRPASWPAFAPAEHCKKTREKSSRGAAIELFRCSVQP